MDSVSSVRGARARANAAAPSVAPTTLRALRRLTVASVMGLPLPDRQEAVARRRHRLERAERRTVGVVAGDAVVATAWSTRLVPMAAHATVGSVLVRTSLGAVALRAELHRLDERDRSTIGEPECVASTRMMARGADQVAVLDFEASMRGSDSTCRRGQGNRRIGILVAGRARHDRRIPSCIRRPHRESTERRWDLDLRRSRRHRHAASTRALLRLAPVRVLAPREKERSQEGGR